MHTSCNHCLKTCNLRAMSDFLYQLDDEDFEEATYSRKFPALRLNTPLKNEGLHEIASGEPHGGTHSQRVSYQASIMADEQVIARKMTSDPTQLFHIWLSRLSNDNSTWHHRFYYMEKDFLDYVNFGISTSMINWSAIIPKTIDKLTSLAKYHSFDTPYITQPMLRSEKDLILLFKYWIVRTFIDDLITWTAHFLSGHKTPYSSKYSIRLKQSFDFDLNESPIITKVAGMKIITTKDLYVFYLMSEVKNPIDHHCTCFNRDYLLSISDLLSQRFILFYSGYLSTLISSVSYLTIQESRLLLDWGDQLLSDTGNPGYDFIGSFESLVTAFFKEQYDDPYCDNTSYGNSIRTEIRETFPQLTHKKYIEQLFHLLTKFSSTSIHKVSQSFGLYRIWGHPIIDVKGGLLKLQKIVKVPKIIPDFIPEDISLKFKRQFFYNYFTKHHLYPPYDYVGPEDDKLNQVLSANKYAFHISQSDMEGQWANIRLRQVFAEDSMLNLPEVLSDKSLSPNKSELNLLMTEGRQLEYTSRRVILSWMKNPYLSSKELLDEINDNGLSEDDLVIGVCPKEREEKIKPRFFALMSLKMRMYFCVTENMISKILKYFPEVTMVDSYLDLQKKLRSLTMQKPADNLKYQDIVINIDFEKWNSNMREDLTKSLFNLLDQLFGYNNLISRTHEFFFKSIIYLTNSLKKDGKNIDELASDENCLHVWKDHLGGFEGLRQKGWTLLTTLQLLLLAEETTHKIKIIGQGDNQLVRLRVKVPPYLSKSDKDIERTEYIRGEVESFLDRMSKKFKTLGLPLKPAETWCSSRFFNYGKNLFFDGAPLPMSIKRFIRSFGKSNDSFPMLENAISTIFANSLSACSNDSTSLMSYIIAVSEARKTYSDYIKYDPILGEGLGTDIIMNPIWKVPTGEQITSVPISIRFEPRYLKQKNTILSGLAICPKVLGGFPNSSPYSFMVRGFPDLTTENLTFLKKVILRGGLDPFYEDIIKRIYCPCLSTHVQPAMLLQDPTSLNLLAPTSGTGAVKNAVRTHLKNMPDINNDYFKTFLELTDHKLDELCDKLVQGDEIWIRLISDILEATIPGFALSVLGRVENATTLTTMVAASGMGNLDAKLKKTESNYFKSVIWRMTEQNIVEGAWNRCTHDYALDLRNLGWKTKILGATVPHPGEIFNFYLVEGFNCDICKDEPNDWTKNYVEMRTTDDLKMSLSELTHHIGPFEPYLGSVTTEKIAIAQDNISVKKDSLLKRPVKLQRVIGWFVQAMSPLGNLINRTLEAVTDINPHFFENHDSVNVGSEDHRYQDSRTSSSGIIANQYTLPSYIKTSTNSMVDFSKGTTNYTMHFQQIMCTGSMMFSHILQYWEMHARILQTKDPINLRLIHQHLACTSCVKETNTTLLTGPKSYDDIILPSQPDSPFCWFKKEHYLTERMALDTPLHHELLDVVIDHSKLTDTEIYYLIAEQNVNTMMDKYIRETKIDVKQSDSTDFKIVWGYKCEPKILLPMIVNVLYSHFIAQDLEDRVYKKRTTDQLRSMFMEYVSKFPKAVFTAFGFMGYTADMKGELLELSEGTVSSNNPTPSDEEVSRLVRSTMIYMIGSLNIQARSVNSFFNPPNPALPAQKYNRINEVRFTHIICNYATVFGFQKEAEKFFKMFFKYIVMHKINLNTVRVSSIIQDLILLDEGVKSDNSFSKFCANLNRLFKDSSRRILYDCDKLTRMVPTKKRTPKAPFGSQYSNKPNVKEMEKEDDANEINQIVSVNPCDLPPTARSLVGTGDFVRNSRPVTRDEIFRGWGSGVTGNDGVKYDRLLLRPMSIPSNAFLKLISVVNFINLPKAENILVVGDGPGGHTSTASMMYPDANIFYNSLISLESLMPHAITEISPSALEFLPRSQRRKIHLLLNGPTDVSTKEFRDAIILKFRKSLDLDFIVCDAEGRVGRDGSQELGIVDGLCSVAQMVGSDNVVLMVKSYQRNLPLLNAQLSILDHYFSEVLCVQTDFTPTSSSEVYLVGRDLKFRSASPESLVTPEGVTVPCLDPENLRLQLIESTVEEQLDARMINNTCKYVAPFQGTRYDHIMSLTIDQLLRRIFLGRSCGLSTGLIDHCLHDGSVWFGRGLKQVPASGKRKTKYKFFKGQLSKGVMDWLMMFLFSVYVKTGYLNIIHETMNLLKNKYRLCMTFDPAKKDYMVFLVAKSNTQEYDKYHKKHFKGHYLGKEPSQLKKTLSTSPSVKYLKKVLSYMVFGMDITPSSGFSSLEIRERTWDYLRNQDTTDAHHWRNIPLENTNELEINTLQISEIKEILIWF
nr:MAG: RNA-dependent RNA polymerase [Hedemora virus]